MSRRQARACADEVGALIDQAGFAVTQQETSSLRLVDTSYDDFRAIGLSLVDLCMHERYGSRLVILLPNQVVPEHWHPSAGEHLGKQETFRLLWGDVEAYVEGHEPAAYRRLFPDAPDATDTWRAGFSAGRRIPLRPGDQCTTRLHERHWFRAGAAGGVALETSSTVRDILDRPNDPNLRFVPVEPNRPRQEGDDD